MTRVVGAFTQIYELYDMVLLDGRQKNPNPEYAYMDTAVPANTSYACLLLAHSLLTGASGTNHPGAWRHTRSPGWHTPAGLPDRTLRNVGLYCGL